MRTQEKWEEMVLPKMLKKLPPRIQKDLESIPFPQKEPSLKSQFIFGQVNTGKTIQAAFIFLAALRRKYFEVSNDQIVFLKSAEMINNFKKCINNPDRSEQDYLDELTNCDILILDDFGTERPTDWVLSLLYLLIDRRYEHLKTTIFTSNKSLGEIAESFGDDRIPSRIERMCKLVEKTGY